MRYSLHNLSYISWFLQNYEVFNNIDDYIISNNSTAIILILEKHKYSSEMIVITRTSKKCIRVMYHNEFSTFRTNKTALDYIMACVVDYTNNAISEENRRKHIVELHERWAKEYADSMAHKRELGYRR